jgi:hypothetical protein
MGPVRARRCSPIVLERADRLWAKSSSLISSHRDTGDAPTTATGGALLSAVEFLTAVVIKFSAGLLARCFLARAFIMLLGYTATDLAGCALLGLRESIASFRNASGFHHLLCIRKAPPTATYSLARRDVVRGRAMELEGVLFGTDISVPLGVDCNKGLCYDGR